MKKIVFTLMTLVALVIVAGSAKAQTAVTPYPGGTYTYTLSDIAVVNGGTVNITTTGTGIISTTTGLTGSANPYGIAKTVTSIAFKIEYPLTASAGDETITVEIFDGTSGCSNSIELDVTVQDLPTLSVSVLASTDETCQEKNAPDDNVAAAVLDGVVVNTHTFTVTPVVDNVATDGVFDYEYAITLPTNTVLKDFKVADGSGKYNATTGTVSYTNVTSVATDVFTVTFKTTTGKSDQTLTATLGASKLTVTAGGGEYTGTTTSTLLDTDDIIIQTMPSIGKFTWQ